MQTSFRPQSWCYLKMFRKADRIFYTPSLCKNGFKTLLSRCYTSNVSPKYHHVAIIGSGPAGFYTAQQLLKGDSNTHVDVFDKLPVPFGLVRFGVAPDHPEVKNVINTFSQTAQKERFKYFGNVEIGKDLTLQELRKSYSAVVLCYGASHDRSLGIPGEDLPNCLSARSFVGWYNGLPEDNELQVDLDCENAVVLGHGNVALDVARILLTPIDMLEKTDITEHALEKLRTSRVKRVYVVGRRGPCQVAFTIKELREMTRLPRVQTLIQSSDVNGLDKIIKDLPRPRRRLTELMFKAGAAPSEDDATRWRDADREWSLVFRRTPLAIQSGPNGKMTGVEFAVNELKGDSLEHQKAVLTDVKETIDCGLVLRSIGYKSSSIDDDIPFDETTGTIRNQASRVEGQKGLYCAGWVGRGPVGVILTTMTDGFDTGKVILQDIESGILPPTDRTLRDQLLDGIKDTAVSFEEWGRIDLAETSLGERRGKPREKFISIQQMLETAKMD